MAREGPTEPSPLYVADPVAPIALIGGLEQLPKQFKAANVRTVRGLKNKQPSEIFAAITRWTESGAVKRKDRGLYERVG